MSIISSTPGSNSTYVKSGRSVPNDFFEAEFIGLQWLSEATAVGGVRVAKPCKYDKSSLEMERITSVGAQIGSSQEFGGKLAITQYFTPITSLSEMPKFGESPSKSHYFGPLSDSIKMPTTPCDTFWGYFIDNRMLPMINVAIKRHEMTKSDLDDTLETLERLRTEWNYLDDQTLYPPVRVHGDLWNGNLLWAEDGAVLIDPSAHIGLGLEDIALLNLFGCSYYPQIVDAYFSSILPENPAILVHPTRPPNLTKLLQLLNLFPLAGHVAFFGGNYLSQYMMMLHSL